MTPLVSLPLFRELVPIQSIKNDIFFRNYWLRKKKEKRGYET